MRRVITGLAVDGRSTIVSTGAPGPVYHFGTTAGPGNHDLIGHEPGPGQPGKGELFVDEIWATDETGEPPAGCLEAGNMFPLECPPRGSRWRIVRFGPNRQSKMHRTHTVDYDFILSGSIELVMEDGTQERLTAGDALILPGTVHAWKTGDEPCTMLVTMVERPEPHLEHDAVGMRSDEKAES